MTRSPEESGNRLRRWRKAAGAWAVVVFAASSWPNPPTPPELPPGFPGLDKLTHLALYGVLGFLVYKGIRWPGRPGFALGRLLTVVGAVAVLGTVDEIHQIWIPGRGMEGADLIADLAGAAIGAALAGLTRKRHPERSEGSSAKPLRASG